MNDYTVEVEATKVVNSFIGNGFNRESVDSYVQVFWLQSVILSFKKCNYKSLGCTNTQMLRVGLVIEMGLYTCNWGLSYLIPMY